jgi:hypothetical protein
LVSSTYCRRIIRAEMQPIDVGRATTNFIDKFIPEI